MNEFEQFLIDNNIDDSEALASLAPIGKDVNVAWQIANMEKNPSPAARDTLPPIYADEASKTGNMNIIGRAIDAVAGMGADAIRNPFSTATTVLAMDPKLYTGLKFLPALAKGTGVEESGAYVDEGIRQAGKLGAHLAQNPEDAYHMLNGLGQSIAEMPSQAAERGRSLWDTLTAEQPSPASSSATASSSMAR